MGKRFLLPLLASLTVAAAVSVPVVAASISQRDENAELVLNYNPKVRHDLIKSSSYFDGVVSYPVNYLATGVYAPPPAGVVAFDSVLPSMDDLSADAPNTFVYGFGINVYYEDSDPEDLYWMVQFLIQDYGAFQYAMFVYVDGVKAENVTKYSYVLDNGVQTWGVEAVLDVASSDAFSGSFHRLWVNPADTYSTYMDQHQVVSGIEAGLPFVSNAAQALVGGFDAMALDNGALTNVMAFSFTLLGLGCAVGICKKVFSWITGRHGM